MIQKIKHTNLNQNCKLSKRADQLKEQVWLVFLMKESRIKTGTIVSDKFQFQLKKVLATAKFSTSVTNLPQAGNSWIIYIFIKLLVYYWFFRETWFANVHLSMFFLSKRFMLFHKEVHTTCEILTFCHTLNYC